MNRYLSGYEGTFTRNILRKVPLSAEHVSNFILQSIPINEYLILLFIAWIFVCSDTFLPRDCIIKLVIFRKRIRYYRLKGIYVVQKKS